MKTTVRFAAGTSTGLVRTNNEDSAYAGQQLHAIADGMGGHVAGEIASAIVIDSLRSCDIQVAAADLTKTLGQAVSQANARLLRATEADPGLRGMGTTLTAMLWSGGSAALAHIGDSRAYLLRNRGFRQITEDHTLGKLVAGSARLAPILVRFLDGRPDRSPDLAFREIRAGDRYLLCSDGLSGVVAPDAMSEVLASVADAGEVVRRLIRLANEAGGPDNTTVIVLDVRDADIEPVAAMTLGAAADALDSHP
jgi:protein phosphatase